MRFDVIQWPQAEIHCVNAPQCNTEAQTCPKDVIVDYFILDLHYNAFCIKHMHKYLALHPVLYPGIQGLAPR